MKTKNKENKVGLLKSFVREFFKPIFSEYKDIEKVSFWMGHSDSCPHGININESDLYINGKHINDYGNREIFKSYCDLLRVRNKLPDSLKEENKNIEISINNMYKAYLESDPFVSFSDFFSEKFISQIDDHSNEDSERFADLFRDVFILELEPIYNNVCVYLNRDGNVEFGVETSYRSITL